MVLQVWFGVLWGFAALNVKKLGKMKKKTHWSFVSAFHSSACMVTPF